jgi:enterochelin esterase-like enzyme
MFVALTQPMLSVVPCVEDRNPARPPAGRVAAFVAVLVVAASAASAAAVIVHKRARVAAAPATVPSAQITPSAAAATASGMQITCPAPALGGKLPTVVYLPAGYSTSAPGYPVVYFLHGLPAGPSSYLGSAFVASALTTARQHAIVVAPQGARQPNSDREYLNWSPTENWPRAITHDLTRCIDSRYNTLAARRGRVLIGLSAGGYGAFNVGLRALQTFGAVESWSGYFVATDPSGEHVLDLGSPETNRAATVPHGAALRATLAKWPALVGFYVGRQDDRFFAMNQDFDAALTAARITHVYHTYPGGHSQALWQSQAPHWLRLALTYLAGLH